MKKRKKYAVVTKTFWSHKDPDTTERQVVMNGIFSSKAKAVEFLTKYRDLLGKSARFESETVVVDSYDDGEFFREDNICVIEMKENVPTYSIL